MKTGAALLLLFLTIPGAAAAQPAVHHKSDRGLTLRGSVGPTMIDTGHSLNVGVGYSATPQLTFVLSAERDHLNYRTDRFSTFRGGTVLFVAGEVQYDLLPRLRVSPYVLAGIGAGISRPNAEGPFDTRVTNTVRTQFAGAGVRVPLRPGLTLNVDARVMLMTERDTLAGVLPVRAGISWQF